MAAERVLSLTDVEYRLLRSLSLGYSVKASAERVGRMVQSPFGYVKAHSHLQLARRRAECTTLYQLLAAFGAADRYEFLPPVPMGRPPGRRNKVKELKDE